MLTSCRRLQTALFGCSAGSLACSLESDALCAVRLLDTATAANMAVDMTATYARACTWRNKERRPRLIERTTTTQTFYLFIY